MPTSDTPPYIITNEKAVRIRGQRRLARARETKEERHVATRAFVRTGVQRKYARLGHEVVHHREYTLLHLASVLRAENDWKVVECDRVLG